MAQFWHRQTADKPLFPELLWSKPENKRQAGKLLIIGGNAHGFAAPAEAYQAATQAGIGTARVLLPDALKKTIGPIIENGEYAPSTLSGSFSQKALSEFVDHASWADGVVLSGDLGRNSETAILLEKFIGNYSGQLTLTKDAADYGLGFMDVLLNRDNTLLVLTMAQLQKLASIVIPATSITYGMDLLHLVEAMRLVTEKYPLSIVVKQNQIIGCATGGQVSTTIMEEDVETWRVRAATYTSVWWLQNPTKAFEALTSAVYESLTGGPS